MGKDKCLTLSYLAFCNIRRRPFRTAALMFTVAILSFGLFLGSVISLSLQNGTDKLSKRLGADILVVPKGYEDRTEKILLRGEPSMFYMNATRMKKISGIEGVRTVSLQLFVASLKADCCSTIVQIIGFDQDTDFTVEPWIQRELTRKLLMNEIVIGANLAGKVGKKLKFFGREYTIAAKMESTGSGFDTSVFMNIEAAKRAADDYAAKSGAARIPEDAVSSVSVLIQDGYTVSDVANNISKAFDQVNGGISVITAENIISNVSGSLRMIERFVVVLAALLWFLSVLILGIVFSVILNERKREFGILRSLGATRKKISSLVLWESAIISLLGGMLGIGFCTLLILPFQIYGLLAMNLPYLQPSVLQFSIITVVSLMLSLATGPIASLFSVLKLSRGDAYSVLRDGDI
ncbi:MAG TPA: ABC transporter permease [Firmicutes bacterium]|jgi:putative ABC transport system permease protein|nr:ABC transporter permease [Bacillota bacterium]